MYSFEIELRVRYKETDQMGYVHHGNYAQYYEYARTEMLRELGLSYSELEGQGIMLPIKEMNSQFVKPARYDDLLTIKTIVKRLPTVTFHCDYEIYNQNNELLNSANTTLVFVDSKTRKPTRPPQNFLDVFEPFFNE